MIPEFGVTPSGRAWLKTLESPTAARPNPLLPKARSLVRNHKVHDLQTSAGRMTATVTDKTPRSVEITFDTWPEEVASAVTRTLNAAGSSVVAQDGDLPDDLIAALAAHGAKLAPPQDEWATTCNCTSRQRPCAHISACIYALVHALDEQPGIAITLRASLTDKLNDSSPGCFEIARLDPSTFYASPREHQQPRDVS